MTSTTCDRQDQRAEGRARKLGQTSAKSPHTTATQETGIIVLTPPPPQAARRKRPPKGSGRLKDPLVGQNLTSANSCFLAAIGISTAAPLVSHCADTRTVAFAAASSAGTEHEFGEEQVRAKRRGNAPASLRSRYSAGAPPGWPVACSGRPSRCRGARRLRKRQRLRCGALWLSGLVPSGSAGRRSHSLGRA